MTVARSALGDGLGQRHACPGWSPVTPTQAGRRRSGAPRQGAPCPSPRQTPLRTEPARPAIRGRNHHHTSGLVPLRPHRGQPPNHASCSHGRSRHDHDQLAVLSLFRGTRPSAREQCGFGWAQIVQLTGTQRTFAEINLPMLHVPAHVSSRVTDSSLATPSTPPPSPERTRSANPDRPASLPELGTRVSLPDTEGQDVRHRDTRSRSPKP